MLTTSKKKNIILIVGAAAIVIFFIGFWVLNRVFENRLDDQIRKEREGLPDGVTRSRIGIKDDSSGTEESTGHRIATQSRGALLENQRYWDRKTENIIKESDVINRMDEAEAFKGVKKTPEQFQRQIDRIEGRIKEYEQQVLADPGDEVARQKLQDLYMIKASVNGLQDAVVEKR